MVALVHAAESVRCDGNRAQTNLALARTGMLLDGSAGLKAVPPIPATAVAAAATVLPTGPSKTVLTEWAEEFDDDGGLRGTRPRRFRGVWQHKPCS